jgi:hypothetical protein
MLRDVVGDAGFAPLFEIALVVFMVAFGAVLCHLFLVTRADRWERARHLPLEPDGTVNSTPEQPSPTSTRGDAT